ncbi:hypothetical protein IIA16_02090, partial [bacterium]|nr:hypothetical protein [bacterium]
MSTDFDSVSEDLAKEIKAFGTEEEEEAVEDHIQALAESDIFLTLAAQARDKGFLTMDQVTAFVESQDLDPDQIQRLFERLEEERVEVISEE